MKDLVRQFVANVADKGHFEFEKCLEELRQLGHQEIVKSSKITMYDNLTASYSEFCTEVRKLVNPSIIARFLKSKAQIELDLKKNLYYVRTIMDNYKLQKDVLYEHQRRLNVMLSIADCFVELSNDSSFYLASPQRIKQIMEVVVQRRYTLVSHIAVISQAIMATQVLISNGQAALDYTGDALHTNELAKLVNEQVKEMSYLKMLDRI